MAIHGNCLEAEESNSTLYGSTSSYSLLVLRNICQLSTCKWRLISPQPQILRDMGPRLREKELKLYGRRQVLQQNVNQPDPLCVGNRESREGERYVLWCLPSRSLHSYTDREDRGTLGILPYLPSGARLCGFGEFMWFEWRVGFMNVQRFDRPLRIVLFQGTIHRHACQPPLNFL